MDCNTARASLSRPGDLRIVDEQGAAAHTHVRGCHACRAYLGQDGALLDAYEREREAPAPAALQERIVKAVERRRRGELIGRVARHAAWPTALLIAIASATVVLRSPSETAATNPPDVFVEDYMRRAVGQDHIETTDPAEVTRFLQRELGLNLSPIMDDALTLERAEICLLEGRRGAMIVYKHEGAVVSHYLLPHDEVSERGPAVSRRAGSTASDMPVVTWAADRVEQALVGEVDPDVLMALAGGR